MREKNFLKVEKREGISQYDKVDRVERNERRDECDRGEEGENMKANEEKNLHFPTTTPSLKVPSI